MAFNVPPARYNPISPYVQYPQFTKFDFDMRRKAEILKYSSNNVSTQTNNLTKNQKWSQLVKNVSVSSYADIVLQQQDICGNYYQIIVKYPDTYTSTVVYDGLSPTGLPLYRTVYTVIPGSLPVCPTVPMPTSASGVPGPVISLYENDAVPLYMYQTKENAYAIINENITAPWVYNTLNNIQFSNSVENTFIVLNIQNTVNEYAYNFTIQCPISIYFDASANVNTNTSGIKITDLTASISTLAVNVYYNNMLVPLQKEYTVQYSDSTSIHFDISMNPFSSGFQITQYIGMLTISNLYLFTQPGYVYEIRLKTIMNNSLPTIFSSYFTNYDSGIYANISKDHVFIQQNAIIHTPFTSTRNTGFSFSGS